MFTFTQTTVCRQSFLEDFQGSGFSYQEISHPPTDYPVIIGCLTLILPLFPYPLCPVPLPFWPTDPCYRRV